jgi:hypothetical protein
MTGSLFASFGIIATWSIGIGTRTGERMSNSKKVTLEDLSDQVDCLARNVTRILQLLSSRDKPKIYIERGYRD